MTSRSNTTIHDNIEKATRNLVYATNIIGGDEFVASKVLEVLSQHNYSRLFFTLLHESVPALLQRISHTDGRSKATITMLKSINTDSIENHFPKAAVDGFATGIASSHNTLIQSFFRVLQITSRAMMLDENVDSETTTQGYIDAKYKASDALTELLSIFTNLNIPQELDVIPIIQSIASDEHYLAFI